MANLRNLDQRGGVEILMFPIPIPIPVPMLDEQQQMALENTLLAFQSLIQALKAKLGDDFLPPELRRFADPLTRERADALVQSIDDHLRHGNQPLAARVAHNDLGMTWDEAHSLTEHWTALTSAERLRKIRIAAVWVALKAMQSPQATAT